ncbi:MAG: tail fiber protein [Saprospiraceae bacterium]|nr:tail fiber protein [Saprospiraceae bacterium]
MGSFVGEINLFSFPFVPPGWMACEGQLLNISANPVLFSLIGTTFGGDGKTTFGLPNLKGKSPIPGLTYCIAIAGMFPPRA